MDEMQEFFHDFNERYHGFSRLSIFTLTRSTDEELVFIKIAVNTIIAAFKKFKIRTEEDSSEKDPRCALAFKYLLLNTDFKCRRHFAEDPENASLVGQCVPRMSPYFLLWTLLELEYEDIFAESLLHLPLDLCVELLEAMKDFVCKMPFHRRLNTLIRVIENCHKKLFITAKLASQSIDYNQSLELLFLLTQQFIALLMSEKFLSLGVVNDSRKQERLGLVLQRVIALTKTCLTNGTADMISTPEISKMYAIDFGKEAEKPSNDNLVRQIGMLNHEFLHILMRKVREIDLSGETFESWASLECPKNPSISLQKSIRNDLHHFISFLKGCDQSVIQKNLLECLQKLKPEIAVMQVVSGLDFGGLSGCTQDKKECIKKIIIQHKEWNQEVIDIVRNNRDFLDCEDVARLFDYLSFILRKPGQQDHKTRTSRTIRTILYERSSEWDAFEAEPFEPSDVPQDPLKSLDLSYGAEIFKKFLRDHQNFTASKNLRKTLLYLLHNPRGISSTLVSVAIGCCEGLTLSPEDLMFLYSAMDLKKDKSLLGESIYSHSLSKWNALKFITLVEFLLKEFLLSADEFASEFLIRWLPTCPGKPEFLNSLTYPDPEFSKIMAMMKFCQSSLKSRCTKKTDLPAVIHDFVAVLSAFRRCVRIPKRSLDEFIAEIRGAADIFLSLYASDHAAHNNTEIFSAKHNLLPIDRYQPPFSKLHWSRSRRQEKSISETILLWGRDCLDGLAELKFSQDVREDHPDAPVNAAAFVCLTDDFIRYLFVNCTQEERVEKAIDVTDSNGFYNFEMYDKAVRILVESALYFLESPSENPPESFACSMLSLAEFTNEVIEGVLTEFNRGIGMELRQLYEFYESLKKNLPILEQSIKHTKFSSLFSSISTLIHDSTLEDAPSSVAFYLMRNAVENFANECLKIPHEEVHFDHEHSPIIARFKVFLEFLNSCIIECFDPVDDDTVDYNTLCATFKTLCTETTTDNQPR